MDNSTKNQKTQVVIIGAGPTGLSLAIQLQRQNIDFIILDKNKTTTTFSKALLLHAHTLEIFQELGLAQKAIEKGQITKGLNLLTNGKQRARINIGEMGEGQSQFAYILSLEQSKTEKLLYEYLQDKDKSVQWESSFKNFEQKENGVIAHYIDNKGLEKSIEADYLIGCDGASSLVRHQMGVTFEGITAPKLFYVADVLLKCPVIDKKEFYFFLNHDGFVLFFSIEGEERYRIVGIVPDEIQQENKTIEFSAIAEHIKQQVMAPIEFTELKWFSNYKVHSRRAGKFAAGRVLIAGDAGHIHTPVGGQGMNTGIQDAYNLAWKLAFALNKKSNASILETYADEREKNATHLLETTDSMFDMMSSTQGTKNWFKLHLLPLIANIVPQTAIGKKRIFPLVSQIGITYSDTDLTIESHIGSIKAGNRMPYFTIEDGRSIFELVNKPEFKILYFGQNASEISIKEISCDLHIFKTIPSFFGKHKEFYIVLRPDNYISYIGNDTIKILHVLNQFSKQ